MDRLKRRLSDTQKKWLIVGGVITLTVVIIGQLLYPRDQLVPLASIDGLDVGGWQQQDATWELDHQLSSNPIQIKIAETGQVYQTVKPADIGLKIDNQPRVEASSYPLWARLLPTSLLWYQLVMAKQAPVYTSDQTKLESFMEQALGNCNLEPKNADITFKDDALLLVPASAGGQCDRDETISALQNVKPTIKEPGVVAIKGSITRPDVTDIEAKNVIDTISSDTKDGVSIKVGDELEIIEQKAILSWLEFAPKGKTLKASINKKKSDAYFATDIAKKVARPAGVTTIKTYDFLVVSKQDGPMGRALDGDKTRQSLAAVVNGDKQMAEALTKATNPKQVYKRSYSQTSTGIAALLTHYDQDNPGVYGVSLKELEGSQAEAHYNQNKVFTTASTYKLFVGFSTLKYVDSGKYKWSDSIVQGRDLKTCFDDMIVKSDNPCAEALIDKIGRARLDQDLRSIGLTKSTFRAKSNQTTSAELAIFLTKLEKKQLPLKSDSRDRLLSAMKRQVYRQGIPAGTSGTVADKVGFLNGLLHDAAIVYSSKGDYVLVILSDKSTWGNLADLTRKIEALR